MKKIIARFIPDAVAKKSMGKKCEKIGKIREIQSTLAVDKLTTTLLKWSLYKYTSLYIICVLIAKIYMNEMPVWDRFSKLKSIWVFI